MIGQVVLHRLADQYTLAAIAVEYTPDEVDLRAWALYADGRLGEVTIPHVMRGLDVNQWQETPSWPTPASPPEIAAVAAELMPVAQLPATMPLMVIVRY